MTDNMTNPSGAATPASPRRIACARCGSEFDCSLSGGCWCAAETARLPLPKSSTGFDDCLCQSCLRAVATDHSGG